MKGQAYIASINWIDPLNPICLVVLKSATCKVARVFRMRMVDLPNIVIKARDV